MPDCTSIYKSNWGQKFEQILKLKSSFCIKYDFLQKKDSLKYYITIIKHLKLWKSKEKIENVNSHLLFVENEYLCICKLVKKMEKTRFFRGFFSEIIYFNTKIIRYIFTEKYFPLESIAMKYLLHILEKDASEKRGVLVEKELCL